MKNVQYTRPVIREILKTVSVSNVDFTLNSEGNYVLTIQGEKVQTDQAKATYMALVGLEKGYQIGVSAGAGKKLAVLEEEIEKLRSEAWETEILKYKFQEKLENNPEKCKYYFIYLYTNGYLNFTDRKEWADNLMAKISQRWSTKMLPMNGVADIIVSEYWDEIWEHV